MDEQIIEQECQKRLVSCDMNIYRCLKHIYCHFYQYDHCNMHKMVRNHHNSLSFTYRDIVATVVRRCTLLGRILNHYIDSLFFQDFMV